MSLRDILAELDIRIRGAADVRAVTLGMDQFRGAGIRASAEATRLAGQLRLLQRAEGDNTHAINETRAALDHARSSADAYGAAAQRLARENRDAFGRFQGTTSSFGGGNFAIARGPSVLSTETLAGVRSGALALAPAIATAAAAFYAVDRAAHAAWAEIHQVITEGDEIGDSAARLGVSARAYQELGYIAEQTGSSAEAAARAFPAIARNLAAAGGHGAQVYRELGVSVRTAGGAMRSQEDIFYDTATALGRMAPGTAQSGLALRAFGRAGAELLPLIRSAPGEIDRLRGRFRELGGGLSGDVVANADAAEHALIDLDLATQGARATIANAFLPALASGIESMATFVAKGRAMVDNSYAIETATKGMAVGIDAIQPFAPALERLGLAAAAAIDPFDLLYLAIDDVVTGSQGGHSVIGGWWDDFARGRGILLSFPGAFEKLRISGQRAVIDVENGARSAIDQIIAFRRAIGLDALDGSVGLVALSASIGADADRRAGVADREATRAGTEERGNVRVASRGGGSPTTTVHAPVSIVVNGATDPQGMSATIDARLAQHRRAIVDSLPRVGTA